jgi:hypothetical protein
MGALASVYTDNLHQNFKTLYATWPPNDPIHLGDYGILQGNVFVRLANVANTLGISFQERKDSTRSGNYEYASANSTDIEFHAAAGASAEGVPVKAGLDITFSSENAVFFNAAGCTPVSIEDQISFGNRIMVLYQSGRWEKKFVVVTGLLLSQSATIIVSGSNNAAISLEASAAAVAAIDLADTSLKLGVRRAKNVAFKVVTESGLAPLVSLSKVQGSFFDDDHFAPQAALLASPAEQSKPPEPRLIQHANGDVDLFRVIG